MAIPPSPKQLCSFAPLLQFAGSGNTVNCNDMREASLRAAMNPPKCPPPRPPEGDPEGDPSSTSKLPSQNPALHPQSLCEPINNSFLSPPPLLPVESPQRVTPRQPEAIFVKPPPPCPSDVRKGFEDELTSEGHFPNDARAHVFSKPPPPQFRKTATNSTADTCPQSSQQRPQSSSPHIVFGSSPVQNHASSSSTATTRATDSGSQSSQQRSQSSSPDIVPGKSPVQDPACSDSTAPARATHERSQSREGPDGQNPPLVPDAEPMLTERKTERLDRQSGPERAADEKLTGAPAKQSSLRLRTPQELRTETQRINSFSANATDFQVLGARPGDSASASAKYKHLMLLLHPDKRNAQVDELAGGKDRVDEAMNRAKAAWERIKTSNRDAPSSTPARSRPWQSNGYYPHPHAEAPQPPRAPSSWPVPPPPPNADRSRRAMARPGPALFFVESFNVD